MIDGFHNITGWAGETHSSKDTLADVFRQSSIAELSRLATELLRVELIPNSETNREPIIARFFEELHDYCDLYKGEMERADYQPLDVALAVHSALVSGTNPFIKDISPIDIIESSDMLLDVSQLDQSRLDQFTQVPHEHQLGYNEASKRSYSQLGNIGTDPI